MKRAATHFANDNERNSFSAIGLAALLIVNRLKNENQLVEAREEHQEHGERNAHCDGADQSDGAYNEQEIPNRIGNRS